jgi:hypothetical protein
MPPPAWRPSSGSARVSRTSAIFAIATSAEPDLILQAMRAGANEFFPWTAGQPTAASRTMEESFHGAVRRTAARRDAASAGARRPCVTLRLPRRQGGRRHDDRGGQLRGGTRAADQAADRHRRPEAVSRRGGAVPRRPAAVHGARRHREPAPPRPRLPARARVEAQVGLDILAGSEQFDRPNAQDAGAIEELLRVLARSTTTSSSTPATPSTPAPWRRSTRPTRSFSWRTPTCRRSATRSGSWIGCGSSAPGASACGAAQPIVRPAPDRAEADRNGARLRDPPHVLERLPDGVDRAQLGRAARAHEPLRARAQFAASRAASARPKSRRRRSRRSVGSGFSSQGSLLSVTP